MGDLGSWEAAESRDSARNTCQSGPTNSGTFQSSQLLPTPGSWSSEGNPQKGSLLDLPFHLQGASALSLSEILTMVSHCQDVIEPGDHGHSTYGDPRCLVLVAIVCERQLPLGCTEGCLQCRTSVSTLSSLCLTTWVQLFIRCSLWGSGPGLWVQLKPEMSNTNLELR